MGPWSSFLIPRGTRSNVIIRGCSTRMPEHGVGAALWPWEATLSPELAPSITACECPSQMLPFPAPARATDLLWQTLSISLAQQMLLISGRCTHQSFSGMKGELLPFPPPPLHPFPPPAAGFLSFIQEIAALPTGLCGGFRLMWSYQAEINWAEYLWSCLLRRKVSGCAKFRKLMRRRENQETDVSRVCVCVCDKNKNN